MPEHCIPPEPKDAPAHQDCNNLGHVFGRIGLCLFCGCAKPDSGIGRDLDRIDAIVLLKRLVGECDTGADDHAWRRCKRCLTLHEIQNHQEPAMRLLRAVLQMLEAR